jgi:hypothetical protein
MLRPPAPGPAPGLIMRDSPCEELCQRRGRDDDALGRRSLAPGHAPTQGGTTPGAGWKTIEPGHRWRLAGLERDRPLAEPQPRMAQALAEEPGREDEFLGHNQPRAEQMLW